MEFCKAFDRHLRRLEKPVAEKLARLYTRYVDEVIANLRGWDKAYGRSKATVPTVQAVLFDLDEAGQVFQAGLMPLVTDVVDAGARRALAHISAGVWDIGRPEVVRWLEGKALKVKTLPETMHEQLRQIVQGGINDGVGAQEIAQRIQDVRPQYQTWMSERTARTETVGANNFGALDCYKQNGATQKEWITSLDDKVRDGSDGEFDHTAAHGETVPIADPFTATGEDLDAPGDPSGSPGNIINCFLDPRTAIFTDGGWKYIKDIAVGDMVLSHTGKFRRVLRLAVPVTHRGEVVRLRFAGYNSGGKQNKTVTVTPDHRFLTADGWKFAKDFAAGDKIMVAGLPCVECGKPAMLYKGNGCCSQSCHTRHAAKKQWDGNEERRAKQSAAASEQLRREYANGTRDRHEIVRKAREVSFANHGPRGYLGAHSREVLAKADAVIKAKYGSRGAMIAKCVWPVLGRNARSGGSAIEQAMAKYLDRLGWTFTAQYAVGRRRVDFYVPAEKLFVECDGVQWHQDKEAEQRRDIEILRQYPDHRIAHVTYGQGDKGAPQWEYRDLATLNHEGQYTMFEVEVVEVEIKRGASRRVWDFAVDEDESYIANGVASHNCRCTLVAAD